MQARRLRVTLLAALVAAGCSAGSNGLTDPCGIGSPCAARRNVAAVILAPFPPALTVGDTATLTASAVDSTGQVILGTSLQYTSTAPTVASVASNGLVTALQPGGTYLVAGAGG